MGLRRSIGIGLVVLIAVAAAAGAAPLAGKASEPAAGIPPKPPTAPAQPAAPKSEAPPAEPLLQIDWRPSLDGALKEAANSRKIVLVFFCADFCEPCKVMERGTLGSRPIALYISRHFIPVRIDDTKSASATSQTYNVRAYPTMIFLGPSGEVLHRVTAPLTPKQFQPLMERVEGLPGLFEAQREKPDDLEANFVLGNSLAILGQMARAAPYLERAAQADAGNQKGRESQARLILAMVPHMEEGDSAKTLALLDKFEAEFKGASEVPIAIFYRGTVLFQNAKLEEGKLREARAVFERLGKEYPKHPQAYEADKAILAIDGRLKAIKEAAARKEKPAKEPAPPAEKKPPEPAKKPEPKPKG